MRAWQSVIYDDPTLPGWLADWVRDGFGYWAVARPDETVIGFGGLRRTTIDGEPVLNLYYRFSPAAWGHGYAGEMVQAALDLAARLDGGEPVVAVIRDVNTPSQRVAERAGLIRAGTIDHGGVPSRLYRLPVGARS